MLLPACLDTLCKLYNEPCIILMQFIAKRISKCNCDFYDNVFLDVKFLKDILYL